MFERYKKLFDLLSVRERRRFSLVMIVMVAVTFAELIGITMLLLLLQVLSSPDKITSNEYLSWAFETFGFTEVFSFQVFLSAVVFVAIMFGLAVKAAGNFLIIRYSVMRGFMLSTRLLEAYLHQPYVWFLGRNSAEINKNVLGEVNALTVKMLTPSLMMLGNIMRAATIVVFLLIVDPLVALVSAFFIGGGYVLIYMRLRKMLNRIGRNMLEANKGRYQMAQEATGGVKEVKLLGLEDQYVDRFRVPALQFARDTTNFKLINQMPRFALETITFSIMITVTLILLVQNDGDLGATVPTLGIFAFSVMRLLPALQAVYGAASSIKSSDPILDLIHSDYQTAIKNQDERPDKSKRLNRIPLNETLELRDITFGYPDAEKTSIRDLDLTIAAKQKIGIVGGTGAGKTTLVDIMLGLLTPESGEILVDDVPLTRTNISEWRRSLGYVPQSIYLTDNTIAENIAFGVKPEAIDMAEVERASRVAALHDFIEQELPDGYDTIVGERGARLSGGQRQRIGIARALYHDPELLIMDEATSALDNLTEQAIMDAVHNIGDDKTIVMIAHRLTTVRECDVIVFLQHGKISAAGTYTELLETNDDFRKMAGE